MEELSFDSDNSICSSNVTHVGKTNKTHVQVIWKIQRYALIVAKR